MTGPEPHMPLIAALGADLRPVKPLRPPLLRAAAWFGLVVVIAGASAAMADTRHMMMRMMGAPDLMVAALAATATAALAALAVFELALPDRSSRWALLPLPAAAVWIGASGLGCLRTWAAPASHAASMGESYDCLMFILALSVPLSIVLVVMLRRAYSLRPALTAATGGLAVAAAAATLLNFFHPYDAAATDLAIHAAAVGLVVVVNGVVGGTLLGRKARR